MATWGRYADIDDPTSGRRVYFISKPSRKQNNLLSAQPTFTEDSHQYLSPATQVLMYGTDS